MSEPRPDLTAHDPQNMRGLVAGFPNQCREALDFARKAALPSWSARPDNVVLTGMGGSAAGGDFVRALFDASGPVPMVVNRDYTLPHWVGNGSLVFVCSYSGNTEETLSAYLQARERGASMVVVSSGGKITEHAQNDGFPVIAIPGGQPPRSALGYLLVPVVHACEQMKLVAPTDWGIFFDALDAVHDIHQDMAELARHLVGKLILLDGVGTNAALVANRWKGQINENAKRMAFASAQPEMSHNEIMGREGMHHQAENWATVQLIVDEPSAKMETRMRIVEKLTNSRSSHHTVKAPAGDLLTQMVALAYMGDWVSLFLAAYGEEDPTAIRSIDLLKSELAKVD